MKTIAIIPARGGSKGIPGKNVKDFCGKPLLAWSILQARASEVIEAVYVPSDSKEILKVAEAYGAIGVVQPEALATDTSPSEEALLYTLDSINKNFEKEAPEVVVFLQATSPLRMPGDIDNAVKKMLEEKADSLFSMSVLENFCSWEEVDGVLKGKTFDPFNRKRRQDREKIYLENGSIYVFFSWILETYKNRFGGKIRMFKMPHWQSNEIDTLEDWEVCSDYFEKKLKGIWAAESISLKAIDLIVYDFDGVMTDNRVLVREDGTEMVAANRSDGMAVNKIDTLGIKQLIMSAEKNSVVHARAGKLKLECIAPCRDKREALEHYCKENRFDLGRVAYVGNDLNDLEVMNIVGWPIAPRDASDEVLSIAKVVTSARGGEGVIRELLGYVSTP